MQYVQRAAICNDHYKGNGFSVGLEVLVLVMTAFELGSHLRPPDANNCCIFNQSINQSSELTMASNSQSSEAPTYNVMNIVSEKTIQ